MRGQRRVVARPVEEMDHDHGSCPFRKMPVEILEMIIGRVHVNDLPQMLLVCRCVRNAFIGSRYWNQYSLVLEHASYALRILYRQLRIRINRTRKVHVSLHELLEAFLEPKCACGSYGRWLVWVANPPRKMCKNCRNDPALHCYSARKLKKKYNLFWDDIPYVPVATVCWEDKKLSNEASSHLIPQGPLRDIAMATGKNISNHDWEPHQQLNSCTGHCRRIYNAVCRLHSPPGTILVNFFDLPSRTVYRELNCNPCQNSASPRSLPYSYSHLLQHVRDYHPGMLPGFELGWHRLGPILREEWEDIGRNPDPNDERAAEGIFWTSWVHFLYMRLPTDSIRIIEKEWEIREIISDSLKHEGTFFGLPRDIPTGAKEILTYDFKRRLVRFILDVEIRGVVERVRREVERHGITALHKYIEETTLFQSMTPWEID